MNFSGDCVLKLTREAVMSALEGALNAARKDGADYIRVTNLGGYSYGPLEVSITTDSIDAVKVSELKEA